MNNEKNYTDEEFQKAFQQILKFYKSRYSSQENPKAFLLGGQPGAGKSALENMINIENKYVSISGDDYRKFHPLYDKLNKIYGKDASKYTQKWSGEMVEYLLKEARKEKWNVILEGTLRKAELPIREAKDFKENGYSVELYVVVVKPEKSFLSNLMRYEELIEEKKIPRLAPKEIHDECVKNFPITVSELYKLKVFDDIKLYDRDKNCIYDMSKTPNIDPKSIIEKEFTREWKKEEYIDYLNQWEKLITKMKNRNAEAIEIEIALNEKENLIKKNKVSKKMFVTLKTLKKHMKYIKDMF